MSFALNRLVGPGLWTVIVLCILQTGFMGQSDAQMTMEKNALDNKAHTHTFTVYYMHSTNRFLFDDTEQRAGTSASVFCSSIQ